MVSRLDLRESKHIFSSRVPGIKHPGYSFWIPTGRFWLVFGRLPPHLLQMQIGVGAYAAGRDPTGRGHRGLLLHDDLNPLRSGAGR